MALTGIFLIARSDILFNSERDRVMWIIIILAVVFLSVLLIILNQFLIRHFYWGPSGQPPRYKSHEQQEKKSQSDD